ncbi:MAG: type II toxin-antitoxin system RelE/ParE family toxin [Acidobacteriota bacterium]|nr:type II toxin-antitoxin system RelE/ParE family toxin [Acidobacteriota bacterium]
MWLDIQATVARISEYPDAGQVVRRTRNLVRRIPLSHFPFFLIYRRREDFLQIVALAHTSRRPYYWRARLPLE